VLLIRFGTVVHPDGARCADVLIDSERIAAVGEDLDLGSAEVVEDGGAYVIPGGIDVHTHFALPVDADRGTPTRGSASRSAPRGGPRPGA
jgi:dihydropyrimidinase